jgi:hypothetical protein
LSEFVEWASRNARALVAGAAGLLVLSVLVGYLLGRAQRAEPEEPVPHGGAEVNNPAGRPADADETGETNPRLLPPPVVPASAGEAPPSYSFVLDGADALLSDIEPVTLKISDLLSNRAADVDTDFKPFVLNNEEFDVLIRTKEIAEP